jgi:predicted RNA binding protein YcfA (HicA-like mRNA interferase family)
MSKLKVLSGKSIIKMLRRFGFVIVDTRGSHVHMMLNGRKATIPFHHELRRKTLLDIYRQLESSLTTADLDEMFYTK